MRSSRLTYSGLCVHSCKCLCVLCLQLRATWRPTSIRAVWCRRTCRWPRSCRRRRIRELRSRARNSMLTCGCLPLSLSHTHHLYSVSTVNLRKKLHTKKWSITLHTNLDWPVWKRLIAHLVKNLNKFSALKYSQHIKWHSKLHKVQCGCIHL